MRSLGWALIQYGSALVRRGDMDTHTHTLTRRTPSKTETGVLVLQAGNTSKPES